MESTMPLSRRDFFRASSGGAAFVIVNPGAVRGTKANSAVTLGCVGLGGRGTADAAGLVAAGGRIVALADVFQDRISAARKLFPVEDSRCFLGFDACRRVCDLELDAVLLATPPGFRPLEFRAAVDSGKHVFMENPIAVDTWGCRTVQAAGENAKSLKRSVVVGLQRRFSLAHREAQKRVSGGALGTIVAARGFSLTQDVWRGRTWARGEFPDELRWMTKNWYCFRCLSGDLITEQNTHNLDVCNWMLGGRPERCSGFGGRKWRRYVGDVLDHFNLTFEYAGGVHLTFMSGQFCALHDSSEWILGSEGTFTSSAGIAKIEGKDPWQWAGENEPERNEWEAFVDSVRNSRPRSDTDHAVDSTFTTILGREAAYRRGEVEWDRLWSENQRLERRAYQTAH
jgi:predicted dehydrogenase